MKTSILSPAEYLRHFTARFGRHLALITALSLSALSPTLAQDVGTPITVTGSNYIPTSGTTITITSTNTVPVTVQNRGSIIGASDWRITGLGNGIDVTGTSTFTGTNLYVSAESLAVQAMQSSTISLTGGTYSAPSNVALYARGSSITGSSLYLEGEVMSVGGKINLYDTTIRATSGTSELGISGTNKYGPFSALYSSESTSTITGSNLTIIAAGNNGAGSVFVAGASAYGSGAIDLVDSSFEVGRIALDARNKGSISGTRLLINSTAALTVSASQNAIIALASSTITTTGSSTGVANMYVGALYAHDNSLITGTDLKITAQGATGGGLEIVKSSTVALYNSTLDVKGNLITAGSQITYETNSDTNTIILDTVTATNGTNVFFAEYSGATNQVIVKNSHLTDNLTTGSASVNNITLQNGSTLTGASTRKGASQLNVALSTADTQWQVAGNSTLTSLNNSGNVDMKTADKSLRTMNMATFTQQASGIIAMSLSGTGGVSNALVTVSGQTKLAGGLELVGDLSAIDKLANGYFVLFNDTGSVGSTLVDGTFDTVTINGVQISLEAVAGTQGGGNFSLGGSEYTLSYAGNATSGAVSGGNDVIIKYVGEAVPEPGTWALMAGGLGLLALTQRRRRSSN